MRRSAAFVTAVLLALAAGCSTGASKESAAEEETVSVGQQGLLDPTTTAPASGTPTPASTAPTQPPPPTTPTTALPANVSTRDDPSGFRLRLIVGDHVRHSTRSGIALQLDYENRSNRVLVIDTSPQLEFVIRDKSGVDRWRDVDCRTKGPETQDFTPGYGVAPGELGKTSWMYPYDRRLGPRDQSFDASKCNLPAGHYDVFGVLEWCAADQPTEAGPQRENRCAPGTTKLLFSAPVAIELVDASAQP